MRTTPTRAWRGVSAADRQTERRAALIEAGVEVIGTAGWANTTVRRVCRAAGLTERYFYEAFDDREALLVAVYEGLLAEGVETVLAAVAAAPRTVRQAARAGIGAAVDLFVGDPRKGRILLLEADDTLLRRRREAIGAHAELLAQVSTELLPGDTPADPVDARLTALALVGSLVEVVGAYLAGHLDVSRERLITHLTELFVAATPVTSSAP
jgi:AcrR family transcriptional regulator